ncbi:MAG: YraN family protein [Humidesulfovibrio sp.]|nr:YraN family protein [Humidesulfovibrio sp.]
MPARHLNVGRIGEDAAAAHLEAKGLKVLERNVALGRLELDLVCEDANTLVFVEVKTRAEGSLGTPADGLTAQKRARLLRAAQGYLSKHDLWQRPCRFDFVSVLVRGGQVTSIEHVEDALRADEQPGKRTSGWQPW